MGAPESEKAIAQQKIDEDGLSSDSDFDGCRSRFCSSSRRHILKDVLRGLLVLTVLGIIVTVIFLLCFFLIQEKQDEKLIDELIDEFSALQDKPIPEFSIGAKDAATSNEVDPPRGDLGGGNDKLLDGREKERRKDDDEPYPGPGLPMEESSPAFEPQDLESTADGRTDVVVNRPFGNKYPRPQPSGLTPEDEAFLSFSDFVPIKVQENTQESDQEHQDFKMAANAEQEMAKSLPEEFPESLPPGVDFDFDKIPPVIITSEKRCEELRLPLCAGSMPWAMTSFPNWVNNTERQHLQESLQYFQSVIVGSQCSPRALEYTCAILEPPCGQDEVPLPPCRQFCIDVSSGCRDFLVEGHSHNGVFECNIFPDSDDPSVCVNVKRRNSPPVDGPEEIVEIDRNEQDTTVLLEDPNVDIFSLQDTTADFHPENAEVETIEEPMVCDHSLFLCEDGSDCFGYDQVCNGIPECLDNSDESNCTETEIIDIQNDKKTMSDVEMGGANTGALLRRPSLSEMLSGSAIVASSQSDGNLESITEQSNSIRSIPRFSPSVNNFKKSSDLVSVSPQSSFSALGNSQGGESFDERRGQSKTTLADLLSSSVAPRSSRVSNVPKQGDLFDIRPSREAKPAQHLLSTPQRTLSHILSSSFTSFASRPLEDSR